MRSRHSLLMVVSVLALAVSTCSRALTDVRPTDRKVLLLGLDGLDLKALEPMLVQGQLPRLFELRRRAMELPMQGERTTMDPSSAGIDPARGWTTVATGAPASRIPGQTGRVHGVVSLSTRVRGRYDEIPVTSQHRKLPAVWDILGAVGVKCAVVNWWTTWPAEPVNGVLVSDRFLLDRFELGPYGPEGRVDIPPVDPAFRHGAKYLTWPDSLADELAAQIKPQFDRPSHPIFAKLRQWMSETQDAGVHGDLSMLRQALLADWLAKESAVTLLKRDPSIQFCASYFDSLDVACHLFWMYSEPEPWQKSPDAATRAKLPPDYAHWSNVIPEVAKAIDSMTGELVDALGKDAVVLVVSDHSMQADAGRGNRDYDLDPLLERLGYLVRDANGAIDWTKTRCFDRPSWGPNFERILSINFEKDWPQGWVKGDTVKMRADAWNEIREKLLGLKVDRHWRLPRSNVDRDTLFGEDHVMPWDVAFTVCPFLPPETKVKLPGGDVPLNSLFPVRRASAKHADYGVLLASFPGARGEELAQRQPPLGKDGARAPFIAPFVLALFGVPPSADENESEVGSDMLFWMLERDEAHRTAIRRVESYGDALGRDDPARPLGARRKELAALIDSPPTTAIPPPKIYPQK
jgi:predicted AlkP superfamily phosphohydrolase/phosphomutase